jgi:REP element-mobilizing transposase RayT
MSAPRAVAAAIEANHVHLLVTALREPVHRFAGRLKGSSSSALLRRPENAGRSRIWTSGYWKVYLFDIEGVAAVAKYIDEHNARRGKVARPYPWLHQGSIY